MAMKRQHVSIEQDPDYEDVSEVQTKRRRVLEEGAKAATQKKIKSIIDQQFSIEVSNKETELLTISERLEVARSMMDRLRACIVASYYGKAGQQKTLQRNPSQPATIHPSVRKYIGKAPPGTPLLAPSQIKKEAPVGINTECKQLGSERVGEMTTHTKASVAAVPVQKPAEETDTRTGRFKQKRRIIVGNVSKSIPADQRDENDQATHKWMVYVRGPKERPNISDVVKKVWFFLHPSYRPNDLVEVSEYPFHLTRRGWGEFPVRVQLHFRDQRNKRLDIIHNLKLDRTYTGLQTLGSETIVDVEIEKDVPALPKPLTACIKKEPGTEDMTVSEANITTCVKTEPQDDYECRVTENGGLKRKLLGQGLSGEARQEPSSPEMSPMLASMLLTTSVGGLNPSVSHGQTLTMIPFQAAGVSGSQGLMKVAPVTPTKNNLIIHQGNSPVNSPTSGSPVRNLVLKGMGSLTTAVLADQKVGESPNVQRPAGGTLSPLIALSPVKSSVNLAMPQQLILTNNASGQSILQTAIPLQTSPQSKVTTAMNQSANSGLIFLKCTDNQGKTFLIPQQVCSTVSPSIRPQNVQNMAQIKTLTTQTSQPVILASGSTKVSPQVTKCVQSSVKTITVASNLATAKPTNQNGPVLFLKPDNNSSVRKVTNLVPTKQGIVPSDSVRINNIAANAHILRNVSPNQIVSPGVRGQQMTAAGAQSLLRGQLKVTPQGLIQIQGQKVTPNHSPSEQKLIHMNGNSGKMSIVNQQKQPLILVPTTVNSKVVGQGKSLLSSPITSLSVSQHNGNILVLNQSSAIQGNNQSFGKLLVSSPMNVSKSSVNHSPSIISGISSMTKSNAISAQSKVIKSPPNHIVIVPMTTQQQSVAMATKGQGQVNSSSKLTSVIVSGVTCSSNNSGKGMTSESRSQERTMLIVVQNDKNKVTSVTCNNTVSQTNSQVQRTMSSLLGSRSVNSLVATATTEVETPVTISSKDKKDKQIIIVNEKEPASDVTHESFEPRERDKKIIVLEAKRRKQTQQSRLPEIPEFIVPLCVSDYPDMLSLIKAAVLRHPVVSMKHGRTLHPYCAPSQEDWLSWNIGKRRASEWQRASSVRQYLRTYLTDSTFHGEPLWTTKQILTWCRIHSYSPHYLERPLHPTSIDLQAETSLISDKQHKHFHSVSNSNSVLQEVTSQQNMMTSSSPSSDSGEEEVDIISTEVKKPVVKQDEPEQTSFVNSELLPSPTGASFVEHAAQKIGVNFSPTEVVSGYHGNVSHGTVYRAMEQFMEDLLRETFALQVNMGRYPDTLGVADVFAALQHLPCADFLTNKFLGVSESTHTLADR
ncbi:YEATS domain-containing protein 2-like [Mya arenaria]|uniref:YEATS domain-containing protein 2-like n=1 Tax=Mya arenaria TaxID=6604 RepID=UPI0022E16124|nr:YEATS domain-containing protein 2-like [Mya arenaria]XP_052803006.1 YEATS domain-containing protein 2-like [Mya arenaria]